MVIKICAVGDIMLDQQPLTDTFGVKDVIQRHGTDFLFDGVRAFFTDADIVFGNLECSIGERPLPADSPPTFFCADTDAAECLGRSGVNALSVANNHIMENGLPIFERTIEILLERGITPIGRRNDVTTLERNGKRIGMLAYSFIDDGIPDSGYNKVTSEEQILEDIEKIRSESDLIIVSIHWGKEYVPYPSPEQVRIGRTLIDAGADIILGGHPHVPQGYEYYKDGIIIYSLGNFIFDQGFVPATRESFIVEITVPDPPRSVEVALYPVLLDEHEYRPRTPNQIQSHSMLERMQATRTTIEGASFAEYQERVGDYEETYRGYLAQARRCMMSHFLKNLYRYPFSTSFGVLRQYLLKQPRRMG